MFSVRSMSAISVVWLAIAASPAAELHAGPARIVLDGVPVPVASASPSGFSAVAAPKGPQLAPETARKLLGWKHSGFSKIRLWRRGTV